MRMTLLTPLPAIVRLAVQCRRLPAAAHRKSRGTVAQGRDNDQPPPGRAASAGTAQGAAAPAAQGAAGLFVSGGGAARAGAVSPAAGAGPAGAAELASDGD